jgi:hypothetical protein
MKSTILSSVRPRQTQKRSTRNIEWQSEQVEGDLDAGYAWLASSTPANVGFLALIKGISADTTSVDAPVRGVSTSFPSSVSAGRIQSEKAVKDPVSGRNNAAENKEPPKIGKYRINLRFFDKFKMTLLDLLEPSIDRLDFGLGDDVDLIGQYKFVKVDGNLGYAFSSDELVAVLEFYMREYDCLLKAIPGYGLGLNGKSVYENFKLGISVSAEILSNAMASDLTSDTAEASSPIVGSTYVLLNRDDKDLSNGDRYKRVLGVVRTLYDYDSQEVFIHQIVAHPYVQAYRAGIDDGEIMSAVAYKEVQQFNVVGIGNFMTLKAIKHSIKQGPVKSIITEATNPRSAAIARKLGMKYEDNT